MSSRGTVRFGAVAMDSVAAVLGAPITAEVTDMAGGGEVSPVHTDHSSIILTCSSPFYAYIPCG